MFQNQQRHKKIHQGYKQIKRVATDVPPSKLYICDDELWVAGTEKGIYVYNLDLELTNRIKHPQFKCVTGVLKTPTGVIVCDSDTGVHHLNHQGDYINLICSGHFSDVCLISPNKIFALEYKQSEIYTLVRNQDSWVKDTHFKLLQYNGPCAADKLCTTSTHLYVSSRDTHCILVYTLDGEYVYKTGKRGHEVGKFNLPLISDVDSGGKLLTCDFWNGRLQLFHTQNKVWSELSGLEGVSSPWYAVVGDKHLWVGERDILLKFEVT